MKMFPRFMGWLAVKFSFAAHFAVRYKALEEDRNQWKRIAQERLAKMQELYSGEGFRALLVQAQEENHLETARLKTVLRYMRRIVSDAGIQYREGDAFRDVDELT